MQKDVLSVYSSKHMFPIFDYLQISKHARYGFDRIEKKKKNQVKGTYKCLYITDENT